VIHTTPDTIGPPLERCCFCRSPSQTWTHLPDRRPGEPVACCALCAGHRHPAEVPTKADWIRADTARAAAPVLDSFTLEPPATRCKHGRGDCEECGTSDRRDALHRTKGGRGAVARLRR